MLIEQTSDTAKDSSNNRQYNKSPYHHGEKTANESSKTI